MSSEHENESSKSGGDENNSGGGSLPLRKRKTMERSGGAKKSSSKTTDGNSSAVTSLRGRGRGGAKPSRGEKNDDPKDPIVDKKVFDGFVDDFDMSDLS